MFEHCLPHEQLLVRFLGVAVEASPEAHLLHLLLANRTVGLEQQMEQVGAWLAVQVVVGCLL